MSSSDVVAFYESKTEAILRRYGPGPGSLSHRVVRITAHGVCCVLVRRAAGPTV